MNKKLRRNGYGLVLLVLLGTAGGSAYGQRVNPNNTRTSTAIETVFAPVVRTAAKSTVKVWVSDGGGTPAQAALGTVVSEDGFVLTKASEIIGRDKVTVQLSRAGEVDAKIVGYNELLDLAMLKIEAKGLVPAVFADTRPPGTAANVGLGGRGGRRGRGGPVPVVATAPLPPEGAINVDVGEWVASPDAAGSMGRDLSPRSVGVISTSRRVVPRRIGFLGVGLPDTPTDREILPEDLEPRVKLIMEDSGADHAGLKVGDLILAIEGTPIKQKGEVSARIQNYAAGDAVRLLVERGKETLVLRAVLGDRQIQTTEDLEIAMLSGDVSKRATFSPVILLNNQPVATTEVTLFEHDTILKPSDMGGPLVDLEGRIIGINIARAGRTETFALPADIIVPALERLKSGVFAPRPAKPE